MTRPTFVAVPSPWWLWVLAAWIWASCVVMAMRIWVG